MQQYQALLMKLLDEDPLRSTWYYQNEHLAALENAIFAILRYDELFDSTDVQHVLQKQGMSYTLAEIAQQLAYMALATQEERLIFRDVTMELYQTFEAVGDSPERHYQQLADSFKSIATETDQMGKIRQFISEFVYVPKLLLLMLADFGQYNALHRTKLAHMKPKFAKYFINCYLELVYATASTMQGDKPPVASTDIATLEAIKDEEINALEKRKIYGRLK